MGFKDHIWSQIGGARREREGRAKKRRGRGRRRREEEKEESSQRYGFYDLCMELGIDLNGYMFVGCGL